MIIVYATTTALKIIDVPTRKDRHVSCGVGKYILASLIGARKAFGKELIDIYANFIGK